MKDVPKVSATGLGKTLKRQFIAGLLVVVPIGATILILVWIFTTIDSLLQPIFLTVWGRTIPGVGFAATIILIYLLGVLANNVLGKRLIHYADSLLARVPVFRQLYTGIKQILESFSTPNKTGFMQVVLVEFPRRGMKAIGFITNEITDPSGEKLFNVLIPTAPNPTTGFLQIVRETEITRTKMSVDDAIKMLVSAGRVVPEKANDKLSGPS